jgi:hypothetical protein
MTTSPSYLTDFKSLCIIRVKAEQHKSDGREEGRNGDYIIWISFCTSILYINSSAYPDGDNGSKVT